LKETFEVEQMELILKKTVESLGEEGDIVKVKSGYARNYLIPKKMAVLANKTNLNLLEQEKATIEARREKQRQEAESLSKKISGTIINIKHRVGEEDKLFGSVTAADISEKLAEMNIQIDKKNVLLAEPIKALGEIIVPIKVGYQMTSEITVQVVPLEAE
jgi:large subunit ribosomal protein L9